ncbi:hypothetical protein [Synechocystis sp. CACIAM 05]|uniref:hypothetical protein n=1 Tax=Synechocystis sp. CACIAM 05 TaxID=1933929 RepID=UPI00138E80FD|nr:hypothetical protein [Synechocystis sp. CACIAM 05]QHV00188.1 hypothetical protein BWK47_08625 [Synechocystis sp. CACIAM 05]
MGLLLLKLMGHALGSIVMYWGLLLLLIAPWVLALPLVVITNGVWNQITGKNEEWQWFGNWTSAIVDVINSLKFQWIGWIPGIIIQVWYAGYAANLVHNLALDKTDIHAILLQLMGSAGVVFAALVFYWLYCLVVEVSLGKWIYILVGVISLTAYFVFLQFPQVAETLGQRWQQIFDSLLWAMV